MKVRPNISFDGKPRHPKFDAYQYHVRTHALDIDRRNGTTTKPRILRICVHEHPETWSDIREYLDLTCDIEWAEENGGWERWEKAMWSTMDRRDEVVEKITKALVRMFQLDPYTNESDVTGALDSYLARATNDQVVTESERLDRIWFAEDTPDPYPQPVVGDVTALWSALQMMMQDDG